MRSSTAGARGGDAPVDSARYVPATLAGCAARQALAADRAWRVFAVFRRSFYCQSARGALVLVGPATLGAGPLHVLWASSGELERRLPAVGTGVGVDLDGAGPGTRAALTLGLRDAREWRPPAPPCWTPSSLRRGLAWLAHAAGRAPAEGLGQLIAPLAAGAADPARLAGAPGVARHAWPALAALSGWARDALVEGRAAGALPDSVDGLVGLGPGLTPSGDDVLAGALLALHAFARPDLADRLAAWLRPRARGAHRSHQSRPSRVCRRRRGRGRPARRPGGPVVRGPGDPRREHGYRRYPRSQLGVGRAGRDRGRGGGLARRRGRPREALDAMPVRARVLTSFYRDSVVLMRVADEVRRRPGVREAALFMGTPANLDLLEQAGLLEAEGRRARPEDLVVAVDADSGEIGDRGARRGRGAAPRPAPRQRRPPPGAAAHARVGRPLAARRQPGGNLRARGLRGARGDAGASPRPPRLPLQRQRPAGRRGPAEAGGAAARSPLHGTGLRHGLPRGRGARVRERGRCVGRIGCVAASGTGLQAVACHLAARGEGISQGIGVGGRDLSVEVDAEMTVLRARGSGRGPGHGRDRARVQAASPRRPRAARRRAGGGAEARGGVRPGICSRARGAIPCAGSRRSSTQPTAAAALARGRTWTTRPFADPPRRQAAARSVPDRRAARRLWHPGSLHGRHARSRSAVRAGAARRGRVARRRRGRAVARTRSSTWATTLTPSGARIP